jgi:tetratricopeptide (TPR) repeat protein
MVSHGLGVEQLRWALTQSRNSNWHPLTWVSLMLDRSLYGPSARGYHLTNVLLHAAAAILLFLVLWQMTDRFWTCAAVAALFAIHPLRVESVAWVTERKDMLSGVFFMLTLLAYLGYARRPLSLARYLSVIALFALGLMCKPMLVTLPLVLLLLDYWPLGRMRNTVALARSSVLARLVLEKVPLLLLSAGSCVLTLWAPGKEHTLIGTAVLPLWSRIANVPVSYVAYLRQFFYPAGLAVMYPWQDVDLPLWKVGGAVLILATVTAAAVFCRRTRPYFLVGWLWYLGMLAPVIGLVQVGEQTMADRFTYLPQIGLCIALILGGSDTCRSWPSRRWAYAAAAACALAVLSAWGWRQATFWSDSKSLWSRDLACTSLNSFAHLCCGQADRSRADEAIAHYRKVLEIHSAFSVLDRFYWAEAYNNLGVVLAGHGRIVEAIPQYLKALELEPNDADAHNNLGVVLADCGRIEEAIAHYQKALIGKPNDAAVHINLGVALADCRRFDEAIAQYRQALEINSDDATVHINFGAALAGCGRLDEAIEHFRTALKLRPSSVNAHVSLGTALAARGRIDEAIEHFQRALVLAKQQNDLALVGALKARLRRYGVGVPPRQRRQTSPSRSTMAGANGTVP